MDNLFNLLPGQAMRIYEVPDLDPVKWIVQVKKNGHRAIVRCKGPGQVKIFSRNGGLLSAAGRVGNAVRGDRTGLDWNVLSEILPWPFILDGELVGPRQAGAEHRLVIWDCILFDGNDWSKDTYGARIWRLAEAWIDLEEHERLDLEVCRGRASEWKTVWDLLGDPDGPDEGLVFKNIDKCLKWHDRPNQKDPWQLKLRKKG